MHPWDIGRLSVAELAQYIEALKDMADEAEKARRR